MPSMSIDENNKNHIFVFGSNLAGRHGAGSAKEAATKFGAVYGFGVGLKGRSFAIPTKDKNLKTLSLTEISKYVENFIRFSIYNKNKDFFIVDIGCGLAGYKPEEICEMFTMLMTDFISGEQQRYVPDNFYFLGEFDRLLKDYPRTSGISFLGRTRE